jgi:hypothetical protein
MAKRNCHCGMLSIANCVKCGNGTCNEHLNSLTRRVYRTPGCARFGYGKTLYDAAVMKGYMSKPLGAFVCHSCRLVDGYAYADQVAEESLRWSPDPLLRAFNAICRGIVHEDHGFGLWQLVDCWRQTPVPPGSVSTSYLKRPARNPVWTPFGRTPYRPAKTGYQRLQGWEFHGTFTQSHEYTSGRLMGCRYESWSGSTIITTDGEVWHNGSGWSDSTQTSRSKGDFAANDLLHLLVEMARQGVAHSAAPWQGPDRGWGVPDFKASDQL